MKQPGAQKVHMTKHTRAKYRISEEDSILSALSFSLQSGEKPSRVWGRVPLKNSIKHIKFKKIYVK